MSLSSRCFVENLLIALPCLTFSLLCLCCTFRNTAEHRGRLLCLTVITIQRRQTAAAPGVLGRLGDVSLCCAVLPPGGGVNFPLDSWPVPSVWQPAETQTLSHTWKHTAIIKNIKKSETLWLLYTQIHNDGHTDTFAIPLTDLSIISPSLWAVCACPRRTHSPDQAVKVDGRSSETTWTNVLWHPLLCRMYHEAVFRSEKIALSFLNSSGLFLIRRLSAAPGGSLSKRF